MSESLPTFPILDLPKPRSEKVECCATCRYWWADASAQPGHDKTAMPIAPCRRFPPQIALGPNLRPLPGDGPVKPTMLPFPGIPADQWCGEYSRKK